MLYFIYQLIQHDFFCPVMNAVYAAHTFHLVCRFQGVCDTFLYFHSSYQHFHAGIAVLVNLYQAILELSFQYEVSVSGRMMLFQKALVQPTIFAKRVFFLFWKFNVRDAIIALPTVSTAHFFKDRFHNALLYLVRFQKLLGYFNSFPITAFPFTTNEPQSYVFGGRNHPLHSNSWL